MADWAIGIDIGGTFTDVVAMNYGTGNLRTLKVLTTHGNPAQGVADGVHKLIELCMIQPAEVSRVVHATTLFTNALIERRGSKTGLLVTEGFKDVIEIGHERKYDLYDLNLEPAPALVERCLRAEIKARMDARGGEIESVDKQDVIRAVQPLIDQGIESLAVCLLHAYANGEHEQQVLNILKQAYPKLDVTLSSEVAPVVREFERLSTTTANAYIKPLASGYLDELQERLRALGLRTDVLMMLSNGGLAHINEAKRAPIELLESGPAAGAISAAHFSQRDGQNNLLAFDMGGTTAKLCLVEDSKPSISYGFEAARQKRFAEGSGLPVRITTIDLIEIGAGGGSIAHQDALGLLKVGPKSAGSEPGPACYGLGGESATVTDANLMLGYLNPTYFAGGTMKISPELSQDAIATVGAALNQDATKVAWGIHDIVAESMAGAARVHVSERGRDPRDFVLLCTGGGGPLHAYSVARKIGVRSILCPPAAGVASALGLLVAPARADRSRTVSVRPGTDSLQELENVYRELEVQVSESLDPLNDSFGPIELERYADGRFVGQGFNLTVKLPNGPYAGASALAEGEVRAALIAAFESAYREKYGRTPPNVPVELLNLRVTGKAPPRQQSRLVPMEGGKTPEPRSRRPVYFPEAMGYLDTPVYARDSLCAGVSLTGPLLVEDEGSTLVVGPGGTMVQQPTGNLVITLAEQQA